MADILSPIQNPKHLYESLYYCTDQFFLSEISLLEIVQLQTLGKVDLGMRPRYTRNSIESINITILPLSDTILETFYDLPQQAQRKHTDPFDRIIIATAISRDMTLVSADSKFPWYQEHARQRLYEI